MYNRAEFLGHVTKSVEVKEFDNGGIVAKTGVASNRKFKTKEGEVKEETVFMDIKLFGNLAKFAAEYLKKGSMVFVEGRLVQERWEDEEGNKRSKHYLYTDTLRLLDKKEQTEGSPQQEEDDEIPA